MHHSTIQEEAIYKKRKGNLLIMHTLFRWVGSGENANHRVELSIETIINLQKKTHTDGNALLYFEVTNADKPYVFRFAQGKVVNR